MTSAERGLAGTAAPVQPADPGMALHRIHLAEVRAEPGTVTGPRRRITDHTHPDYWTEVEQHRYEDRMAGELSDIKRELRTLGNRILLVMGALGLAAFILPLVAPFIRSVLFGGIP